MVRVPASYLSLCFTGLVWVSEPVTAGGRESFLSADPTQFCRTEGNIAVGDVRLLVEVDC